MVATRNELSDAWPKGGALQYIARRMEETIIRVDRDREKRTKRGSAVTLITPFNQTSWRPNVGSSSEGLVWSESCALATHLHRKVPAMAPQAHMGLRLSRM